MATSRTRASTSNTPVKEKRGISPSNTGTAPRKLEQKTNSPAKNHNPTNSSGKPVPNYLKATLSSGPEKTNDAANKATFNRRRSFDKPQSLYSQTQQIKSRVSPNPSSRSSSTGRISNVSSQRTASDKGLVRGTTKDSVSKQQHGLYARSTGSNNTNKKSTTSVYAKRQVGTSTGSSMIKKEEVAISSKEKVEDHNVSDDVAEAGVACEVQESLPAEKVEDGNGKEEDVESEEVEEVNNDHRTEVTESDKDAKIVTAESSTVMEQQHDEDDESVGVKSEEEAEEKTQVNIANQDDSKEVIVNEVNDYNTDNNNENELVVAEINNNNLNDDVEEKDEKEEDNKTESTETANASDEASRKEAKEADHQVKEVIVENKPEEAKVTAKYQGKRESAVSNDVIEETATKLREQRKNKVKALAGAFETVISLQEPK